MWHIATDAVMSRAASGDRLDAGRQRGWCAKLPILQSANVRIKTLPGLPISAEQACHAADGEDIRSMI